MIMLYWEKIRKCKIFLVNYRVNVMYYIDVYKEMLLEYIWKVLKEIK